MAVFSVSTVSNSSLPIFVSVCFSRVICRKASRETGALSAGRLKTELSAGRCRVYSPAGVFLGLGEFGEGEEGPVLRVLRVTGDV